MLWGRSLPNWASWIPGWMAPTAFFASRPFSRPGMMKTLHPLMCSPSISPSSEPWAPALPMTQIKPVPKLFSTCAPLPSISSATPGNMLSPPPLTIAIANPFISITTPLVAHLPSTFPPAICTLGHWKANAIFLYLWTQHSCLTSNFSCTMLQHGQYNFSPTADTYADKDLLPLEAPTCLTTTLQATDIIPP